MKTRSCNWIALLPPYSGHVIDGGYFENYGANTLTNLIDWIKRSSNDPSVSHKYGNPFSGGLIVMDVNVYEAWRTRASRVLQKGQGRPRAGQAQ